MPVQQLSLDENKMQEPDYSIYVSGLVHVTYSPHLIADESLVDTLASQVPEYKQA